jgi:hypothetical protein
LEKKGESMARVKDKRVQENVNRLVGWLLEHRAEFENQGIEENNLASQLGLSGDEVTRSVDYLENHEDVVRWPNSIDKGARFTLKPGRGWPALRDKQR